MKKSLMNKVVGLKSLAAVAAVVLGYSVQSQAAPVAVGPVVSLQFAGGDFNFPPSTITSPYSSIQNTSTVAGALPASNWNYAVDMQQNSGGSNTSSLSWTGPQNYPPTNNEAVLVDSTGTTTAGGAYYSAGGVTYSYSYTTARQSNGSGFSGGDQLLAGETAGVQQNGDAVLTISGLSPTQTYDIIAEVGPTFFGGAPLEAVKLGSTTYYMTASSSLSTWTQSNATTALAGASSVANYVEFDNLTGSSQTLSVLDNGNFYGLNGIQIVPVSVPEPATLSLLGLGAPLLLKRRRRQA